MHPHHRLVDTGRIDHRSYVWCAHKFWRIVVDVSDTDLDICLCDTCLRSSCVLGLDHKLMDDLGLTVQTRPNCHSPAVGVNGEVGVNDREIEL